MAESWRIREGLHQFIFLPTPAFRPGFACEISLSRSRLRLQKGVPPHQKLGPNRKKIRNPILLSMHSRTGWNRRWLVWYLGALKDNELAVFKKWELDDLTKLVVVPWTVRRFFALFSPEPHKPSRNLPFLWLIPLIWRRLSGLHPS
jgi:hypothetical protein